MGGFIPTNRNSKHKVYFTFFGTMIWNHLKEAYNIEALCMYKESKPERKTPYFNLIPLICRLLSNPLH